MSEASQTDTYVGKNEMHVWRHESQQQVENVLALLSWDNIPYFPFS